MLEEILVDIVILINILSLFLLAEHVPNYLVFGIRYLHLDNLGTHSCPTYTVFTILKCK